jgi:hypothetical protein
LKHLLNSHIIMPFSSHTAIYISKIFIFFFKIHIINRFFYFLINLLKNLRTDFIGIATKLWLAPFR